MSSSFLVTLDGDAPKRRFLTTDAAVGDQAVMRLAIAGDVAVGVTDGVDMLDEDEFTFSVSGRAVWEVEAGEAIDPGNFVRAGTDGKAFVCDPGDQYAVGVCMDDAASAGTIVRVAPHRGMNVNGLTGTAPVVDDSVANDTAGIVSDFNDLLAALRTRGVIGGS